MKFSYERDDTYVIILCLYLRQSFEIFLQFDVLSILITTCIREFYHKRDSSKRENISFRSVIQYFEVLEFFYYLVCSTSLSFYCLKKSYFQMIRPMPQYSYSRIFCLKWLLNSASNDILGCRPKHWNTGMD